MLLAGETKKVKLTEKEKNTLAWSATFKTVRNLLVLVLFLSALVYLVYLATEFIIDKGYLELVKDISTSVVVVLFIRFCAKNPSVQGRDG
jgi:hypothetical protein